ncbi:ABC-type polysaccharide/polyol phosphate transport system, ATPase component [Rivularia sp. PCC 7116]|uniref:ABC transporter ATP-binding protein n=1 Tax=Rivularia sp. PCC 7116 TaxID=373994 RepID=UPI00029F4ADF|nr:ABC transporter ATP-binding protein [Rivularia sp. PCC 7116]AFY59008.1 ABC-type polysaccharide/polyol phosphate transport system, ATPase component [Rivularia sp. PCC 7116]
MQDIIVVENLGKSFNRYQENKPRTVMEAALSGLRGLNAVDRFWALRNISFTVSPGEMLGILGHNGAGKSTLLQLIGGVGYPDEGKVKIKGRIGALLDLGASFSHDLTGRENIFVAGVVAGLSREKVAKSLDTIVEFAELEEFIDNPVRTYSTGMQMRLAFAVAVHTQPDIMLVDEFLSVGDLAFQTKCLKRIEELKNSGCAIILISHNAEQVEELCDKALWLRQGQILAYGEPKLVASQFVNEMQLQTQQRTPKKSSQMTASGVELLMNENRFGSLEVEITDINLLPDKEINSGDSLSIIIEYLSHEVIDSPIFSTSITTSNNQKCLDINTADMGILLPKILGKGQIKLEFDRLDLSGGEYFLDIGIYKSNWAYTYDYHSQAYSLKVRSSRDSKGILNPPLRWKFMQLE